MDYESVSARQDDVRFSINVPAQSLSFEHYLRGLGFCRATLPETRRRFGRLPLFIITAFFMWLVIALAVSLFNGNFHFRFMGWVADDTTDDYLFYFRDGAALSLLVLCYIAGVLTVKITMTRRYRQWSRRYYEVNDANRYGYSLELTNEGVRWTHADNHASHAFMAWSKVTSVMSDGTLDYIVMGPAGFLWIPIHLPDYPQEKVIAFIKQHL